MKQSCMVTAQYVLQKLETCKEALNALEAIYQLLEHEGHGVEALSVGASIYHLFAMKNRNARQST